MGCNQSKDLDDAYNLGPDGDTATKVSESKTGSLREEKVIKALRTKRGVIMAERLDISEPYLKREFEKSPEAVQLITQSLAENFFLFNEISPALQTEMVGAMELKEFEVGQNIIEQGTKGDFMYVVESGSWDVFVDGDKKVTVEAGGLFGELALLYNAPRAATVTLASGPGVVHALDRVTFRHMLASTSHQNSAQIKAGLANVPLLKNLTEEQLGALVDAVHIVEFGDGENIIRKGDPGEVFYIIKQGTVCCSDQTSETFEDVILNTGEYFGERALLLDEPRAVDVDAAGPVNCMALDREAFNEVLGPLRELLDFNLGLRVLKSVPLLANLRDEERQQVIDALVTEEVSAGTVIIRQGSPGHKFYIIREGEASVLIDDEEVTTLRSGNYFGERALLTEEPRAATVRATSAVSLFSLDRGTFTALLGSVQDIMERKMEEEDEEKSSGHRLRTDIAFDDLTAVRTLGTGTFGRVKLVTYEEEAMALKCLQKQQIVEFGLQANIMYEKNMMIQSAHPFILRLLNTYKDRDQLYMLLELVQGGELFTRLNQKDGLLPTSHARFYAACVLDAFQYIHEKNICYRDLKPENLLIDKEGYIKVVDFGFAKVVHDRTYTLCGTPEYLAPEIVLGRGHNKGVDYWALGVLIYEMLTGLTPFADYESNDTRIICRNIMQGDLVFPSSMRDSKAKDLIRKLLVRDSHLRLGCLKRGAQDIKDHPWFRDMDWTALVEKRLKVPWVPAVRDALDTSNFDPYDEDEMVEPYQDDGSNWDADF